MPPSKSTNGLPMVNHNIPARILVLDPALGLLDEAEVSRRLRSHLDKIYEDQLAEPPRASIGRIQRRTTAYVSRKRYALRLHDLKEADRAPIAALARHGAALAGPQNEHQSDVLFSQLHDASPWMADLSTFLMKRARLHYRSGGQGFRIPPLILVGEAGLGKSWYARELARLSGLPFHELDAGAAGAAFRITGVEKGWVTSHPGLPVQTLLTRQIANPVIVVNEVDKCGVLSGKHIGDTSLTTALLPLLEPSTAKMFECPCLRFRIDLSHVNWVLTANVLDLVPPTLRDRCEVFHIPPLTPDQILGFFNKFAVDVEEDDLKQATRTFIREMAQRPRGISLRRVQSLINDLKAGDSDPALH